MSDQIKILCIGDSIVEGYPYGKDASWVSHAQEQRKKQGEERWINAGISGQTTGEIRRRFERTMQRWNPTLVIFSCGTNDFIFLEGEAGEPLSAWINIKAMAEEAQRQGAKTVIAAPPLTIPHQAIRRWSDGTDYGEVNRKLMELRQRIREWCEETEGIFWDVQKNFASCTMEEELFLDGIHPTRKGYQNMADWLCQLLEQIDAFV